MKTCTTLAVLFVVIGISTARAQTSFEIGPRVGFDLAGDVEELFLGADARIGVASLPVLLNGTFDYYLVDNYDLWQLSLNALYEFGVDNQAFTPYAGGGLGITRYSFDIDSEFVDLDTSSTDVGLNIIGGAIFELGNLKPFAQAQITFGDFDLFSIAGGLLFSIGGQ